jgi:transposase
LATCYAGVRPLPNQPFPVTPRNAPMRSSLYMPALSAMRFNPAVAALVARLRSAGRLKPKQIVVAAMRELLVLCFGVLKTGKRFDPAIAMSA